MQNLEKQFDFFAAIERLDPQPETVSVSQFRRGLGDIYPTFTVTFKYETPINKLSAVIADQIEQLEAVGLWVQSFRVPHDATPERKGRKKEFDTGKTAFEPGSTVRIGVEFRLYTPVQYSIDRGVDEQWIEAVRSMFSNRGR